LFTFPTSEIEGNGYREKEEEAMGCGRVEGFK